MSVTTAINESDDSKVASTLNLFPVSRCVVGQCCSISGGTQWSPLSPVAYVSCAAFEECFQLFTSFLWVTRCCA
jgi:hypothetical protein